MSEFPTLEVVDRDGAIREAAEAAGIDRRNFLRTGAIAGGGIVAGSAFFGLLDAAEAKISTKRPSKKNDIKILNYALTLEFLEAAFYEQAVRNQVAQSDPVVAKFAAVVAAHEAQHVKFLKKALGSKAVDEPTFDFGDTVTDLAKFKATAQVLEDTGVSAYAGQGPNIKQRPVVQAALSIHSVEARHAAWIRFLNYGGTGTDANLPAPADFDKALSEKKVLKAVTGTGFIKG
ncbi:MAG TPA: ferritin-like domain-containing protein [Solirubrobacteraceae bacterium]|jgi:hypothetical protein